MLYVYMLYFLKGIWRMVVAQNSFLLLHLLIISFFGLFYRYMSYSGVWGLIDREVSELSSLHSSLYYSLITEFTIGALNNPVSFWLRSCVMVQILTSFIFLNLQVAPLDPPAKKHRKKRVLMGLLPRFPKIVFFEINDFFRVFLT